MLLPVRNMETFDIEFFEVVMRFDKEQDEHLPGLSEIGVDNTKPMGITIVYGINENRSLTKIPTSELITALAIYYGIDKSMFYQIRVSKYVSDIFDNNVLLEICNVEPEQLPKP